MRRASNLDSRDTWTGFLIPPLNLTDEMMKCSQCSQDAEYHKNPKTGQNSKAPEHAFCARCWEYVYRLTCRDELFWSNHIVQQRTGMAGVKRIMRRVKSERYEVS